MRHNTSHTRPRTARLEAAVFRLTRLYRRRRAEGRAVAWLIARSNRLSTAYLAAREAELSSPL